MLLGLVAAAALLLLGVVPACCWALLALPAAVLRAWSSPPWSTGVVRGTARVAVWGPAAQGAVWPGGRFALLGVLSAVVVVGG